MGQQPKRRRFRNVVGKQIAAARSARGLTQEAFAAKLQIAGLDGLEKTGISKIEHQVRSVQDYELHIIAHILKVPIESLFPPLGETKDSLPDLKEGYQS